MSLVNLAIHYDVNVVSEVKTIRRLTFATCTIFATHFVVE